MLRRLGIRGKVLAALSVPVLVLFGLAGLVSWEALQDVRSSRAVQDVLGAVVQAQRVVGELQDERSVTLADRSPIGVTGQSVESARDATDTAIARLRNIAAKVDFEALDPTVKAAFDRINGQIGFLTSARTFADGRQVAPSVIEQQYNAVIDAVVMFPANVAQALEDRQLAVILTAGAELDSLSEAYHRELVQGRDAIANAHAGDADLAALSRLSETVASSDDLRGDVAGTLAALDSDLSISETILIGDADYDYAGFRRSLTRLGDADLAQISYAQSLPPESWVQAAQNEIDSLADPAAEISDMASDRATVVANAALREAVLSISVTALAVIASIVIALSIARQIVRPIRRLTEAAATVRDELPHLVEQVAIPGQGPDLRLTKIPVESRDEVGRLATAFNEVNATTIEVAQEQAALRASIAEMFVNVARRDQILLNRQLSFIDALERSEEDPKTLADLFRLDHLATRMRRNSESLLVLAGIDTGRRLREPLPTSDVIRTASSEIEHYERIQLELPVDPLMLGHTALPTAHMLAEILENATVFSDPGSPVHVSTGIDEESVIITVLDQGLGMTPEELTQANARLQTTSANEVLGAQRLGLYVVGRIAARLGATVKMENGPDDRGLLVTVRMPKVLFVNPDAIPLTPPTAAPARVETFVAPEAAAGVVGGPATGPLPDGVQDVAAGAIGSVENPAEAVDLSKLVEGTTQTGLPKRRAHSDGAPAWDMSGGDERAATAIPLAPAPEALAGAAAAAVEEVWQPPVVQTSTPLVQRRRPDEDDAPAATGLPQRQPGSTAAAAPVVTGGQPPVPQSTVGGTTASGLPTRRPAAPVGPPAREAVDASRATGPANVEGRTAMFQGFRSRRAEVAASLVQEGAAQDMGETDAVDRLAQAATGAAAFFQRPGADAGAPAEAAPVDEAAAPVAPAEEPMVIPALVDDEDDFGDPEFAPPAAQVPADAAPVLDAEAPAIRPADEVPFEVFAAEPAPAWPPAAVAEPAPAAEVWAPQMATDAPAPAAEVWAPQMATETPAPAAEVWAPQMATETPAPAAEVWAPQMATETPAPAAESPWPTEAPAAEAVSPWAAAPVEPATPAAPTSPVTSAVWGPTPTAAPATPAAEPVTPAAAAMPALPTFTPSVDFSELVHGPTRRSLREQPKRRWFRRRRDEQPEPAPAKPATPAATFPAAAPIAPATPVVPETAAPQAGADFPVISPTPSAGQVPVFTPPTPEPVRQSAWGAPTTGSHAVVEPAPAPVEPEPTPAPQAPVTFEPGPAPVAPAAQAPTTGPIATPAPAEAAWQPAQQAGWAPEPWQPAGPATTGPIAAPAPAAFEPPAAASAAAPAPLPTRSAPAAYSGPQTFTPEPMFGLDEEMTNMLAQRADIAQQALAELSQLSTYRPKAVERSSSSKLQRRTPSAVPAAPAIKTTSASPRPARDANQVRSLLSSFQSGTSRGRKLAGNDAPQTAGENGLAGSEERPNGTGEPVSIPDTDLSTRDTSW